MRSKKSFREFCTENGSTFAWASRKIGMHEKVIYRVLSDQMPFPKKYWKKIIEVTKGRVTREDLIEDYLVFKLQQLPFVTMKKVEDGWLVQAKE